MTSVSLDALFTLAGMSPLLDKVEVQLRAGGHVKAADDLLKVQQDAGVQIDREMNGYDPAEPAPGPQTAALNAAYEPVTVSRLNGVLRQVHGLLPEDALKKEFASAIGTMSVPEAPPSSGPPAPKA
jgi:hypothetical protein